MEKAIQCLWYKGLEKENDLIWVALFFKKKKKKLFILYWGSSAGKESICKCRRPQSDSWVRKICWRRDRLPTPVFLGFPGGSAGKESACNVGDLGSLPGLERSPGEGNGYPLQHSGLENSMDRGTR